MSATILLVEDDAAIRETLSMFLRYESFNVLCADSVRQANEILLSNRPDIVLLDYMLRDDTAEGVVLCLRRNWGNEVPIILLTAVDRARAIGAEIGVSMVVPKPFELDQLMRSISKALNGCAELPAGATFSVVPNVEKSSGADDLTLRS